MSDASESALQLDLEFTEDELQLAPPYDSISTGILKVLGNGSQLVRARIADRLMGIASAAWTGKKVGELEKSGDLEIVGSTIAGSKYVAGPKSIFQITPQGRERLRFDLLAANPVGMSFNQLQHLREYDMLTLLTADRRKRAIAHSLYHDGAQRSTVLRDSSLRVNRSELLDMRHDHIVHEISRMWHLRPLAKNIMGLEPDFDSGNIAVRFAADHGIADYTHLVQPHMAREALPQTTLPYEIIRSCCSDFRRSLISILVEKKRLSDAELREELGAAERTVGYALRYLHELGVISIINNDEERSVLTYELTDIGMQLHDYYQEYIEAAGSLPFHMGVQGNRTQKKKVA